MLMHFPSHNGFSLSAKNATTSLKNSFLTIRLRTSTTAVTLWKQWSNNNMFVSEPTRIYDTSEIQNHYNINTISINVTYYLHNPKWIRINIISNFRIIE